MSDSEPQTVRWSLRAHNVGKGMHPAKKVYRIHEADGNTTESFAWRIINGVIDIGFPVRQREDGAYLVELPQETIDGRWRVWVKPEELLNGK